MRPVLVFVAVATMPIATIDAQAGAPPPRDSAGVVRQPTLATPRRSSQRDSVQKPTAKNPSGDTVPTTREIVGRVIGPKGYPDAGVVVSATARAAGGDTLWSAVTLTTAPPNGGRGADFGFEYPNTPKLRRARVDVDVARQKVTKADTLPNVKHGAPAADANGAAPQPKPDAPENQPATPKR